MGTNQRGGLNRFILGSTARDVLLASKRDVLVVLPSQLSRSCLAEGVPSELSVVH